MHYFKRIENCLHCHNPNKQNWILLFLFTEQSGYISCVIGIMLHHLFYRIILLIFHQKHFYTSFIEEKDIAFKLIIDTRMSNGRNNTFTERTSNISICILLTEKITCICDQFHRLMNYDALF